MALRLASDDQPNQGQVPVHGAAEQEAVELYLAEGLTCRAVAQRLGQGAIGQARLDRGDHGATDQG